MEETPEPVALGDGKLAPAAFSFHVKLESLYDLDFEAVFEAGRFVVDRLSVHRRADGPPVTTEGLREIPVGGLLRAAVELNVQYVDQTGVAGKTTSWLEVQRRDSKPTDLELEIVAGAYRAAYAAGAPPTKAVMDKLGVTRSTAGRRIRMARDRGLLGPATPRKAGG
jgi:hypothetical protein